MESGKSITIGSKEVEQKAKSNFMIQSGSKLTVESKTKEEKHLKYDLKGKTVDINGEAMTNVKGGMVNLN